MKQLAIAALVAAALVPGPSASAANGLIQPGDYMVAGNSACTTNFVYDGGGKVYLGTAAHCVASVGQDVRNIDGEVWGDVALIGNANVNAEDYAFIEVRPAFVSRVSAKVKGPYNYPTGYTVPSDTTIGDVVQVSGYGVGYSALTVTQERRQAVLTYDDANEADVLGPIHFGDSGGPLVHVKTGKALGIVSRLCVGACSETGPTVQGILAKAAARNFNVSLRTYP